MASTPLGFPLFAETDSADVAAKLNAISTALDTYLTKPQWQAITGLSAGANAGSPAPMFSTWPDGRVECRGDITATSQFATGGVLLATLPAGARPAVKCSFVVAWNGTATQPPTLQVDTAGGLTLFCTSGVTAVTLDAVRFRTS